MHGSGLLGFFFQIPLWNCVTFSIYRRANQRNQNVIWGHRAPTLPNFILFTTYCFGARIVTHLKVYYYGKKLSLLVMTEINLKKKLKSSVKFVQKNPLWIRKCNWGKWKFLEMINTWKYFEQGKYLSIVSQTCNCCTGICKLAIYFPLE